LAGTKAGDDRDDVLTTYLRGEDNGKNGVSKVLYLAKTLREEMLEGGVKNRGTGGGSKKTNSRWPTKKPVFWQRTDKRERRNIAMANQEEGSEGVWLKSSCHIRRNRMTFKEDGEWGEKNLETIHKKKGVRDPRPYKGGSEKAGRKGERTLFDLLPNAQEEGGQKGCQKGTHTCGEKEGLSTRREIHVFKERILREGRKKWDSS